MSLASIETPFALNPLELELTHEALPPEAILEGNPQTASIALASGGTGQASVGVWEITPGVITGREIQETFVVLAGRATIEIRNGATLEIGPGDVAAMREGDETVWRIHETLRKVYFAYAP
jgi:uncharacterized cupin superfamily protein